MPKGKISKKDASANRLENFKREVVTDNHVVSLDQLCGRLETNVTRGLTKSKVKQIFLRTGANSLTPSRKDPEYIKFIKTITQGFSILMWLGSALCFIGVIISYSSDATIDSDNLILGVVLIIIIMLTGIFMYCQESKSSKIMDSFANMIPQHATVIRDSETFTINVKEVVIGDLVEMKFGDKIPADVRITKSQGFKVDNSCLTGENEPLLRTSECTNVNILETKNMAFFSTSAVEGTAQGIVVACGDNTIMGRIAGLTARLHAAPTPIARELHRFIKLISVWACFLGITFGTASLFLEYSFVESGLFLIGIIVANVPEGLLATVTVSLTVTAKKMAAKNCLVKNLEAVETLGSTSVICSDKTGTLTQNRMTVCHLYYNDDVHNADVSVDQYDARKYKDNDDFKALLRCATLCNRAEFVTGEEGTPILSREVRGDASEAAILKFVALSNPEAKDYRNQHAKLCEIPFSSITKYQVSVHTNRDHCILVMKGAPEGILEKCTTIKINGSTSELTRATRMKCDKACLELAARGERVLGFCDLVLKDTYTPHYPFTIDPVPNFPVDGLRFVGFISLIDPPRPQVPDAVAKCRSAGVKVIMVTGDHPVSNVSFAFDIPILERRHYNIFDNY